ncbi:MAG TPA: hypothetical protein VF029_06365 [Actinomycetota bacterium]
MRRPPLAVVALLALFVAAGALVAAELAAGALDVGSLAVRDPCEPRPPYPGTGIDATVQRIVFDGVDGAACELGTTREELVLALAPSSGRPIEWDDATIERAVRAGLLRSIDDAERRGTLSALVATVLRELAERAPIWWLVDGGQALGSLLD